MPNSPHAAGRWPAVLIALLLGLLLSPQLRADSPDPAVLGLLARGSLEQKGEAIAVLAADPARRPLLAALQEGRLQVGKADDRLVIVGDAADEQTLRDAVSGVALPAAEPGQLAKITLNNRLRSQLRKAISLLDLTAADPALRLKAVLDLEKDPDPTVVAQLSARLPGENAGEVRQAIERILLLKVLDDGGRDEQLAAIDTLKARNSQQVLNRLRMLSEQDADGNGQAGDALVRQRAELAVRDMESRRQWFAAGETVFFGLSLGAVLALAATGLAITFGVMGVINMAHGELMMLGAYTTYVMQQWLPGQLGLAMLLAVPAGFMVAALAGIVIERCVIRFLYGRPLETLLATFGISLVLQQSVRTVFSPLNRSVATPSWMSGSLEINDFLTLTWNRLYILAFCLLVFGFLAQVLQRTRLGLEVRAVAQNRRMASAMGIPTARVDAMTFGLGSGIAGVAGVALSQITNVGPNLGQAYIVDSFMVVVFGGVGNLFGSLVAGFSLGIADKVLEPYAGAVLAKILVLVFIILFIQKKPRGLFPQKGRAVEN